jgi:hypothetical protein
MQKKEKGKVSLFLIPTLEESEQFRPLFSRSGVLGTVRVRAAQVADAQAQRKGHYYYYYYYYYYILSLIVRYCIFSFSAPLQLTV